MVTACASARSLPERRMVGGHPIGASIGVRILGPVARRARPRSRVLMLMNLAVGLVAAIPDLELAGKNEKAIR